MDACNNGHFWMFHVSEVTSTERKEGAQTLVWSQIPKSEVDFEKSQSIQDSDAFIR